MTTISNQRHRLRISPAVAMLHRTTEMKDERNVCRVFRTLLIIQWEKRDNSTKGTQLRHIITSEYQISGYHHHQKSEVHADQKQHRTQ